MFVNFYQNYKNVDFTFSTTIYEVTSKLDVKLKIEAFYIRENFYNHGVIQHILERAKNISLPK